jgi:hypothetical protein
MNIKNVLKNTTAMVCGRIDRVENNFDKMAGILEYNKSVLSSCDSVILMLNKEHSIPYSETTRIFDLYKQTFNKCYFLEPHPVGMGHQIGHITLDSIGYRFIKNNIGTKYTMKLCNDILVSEKFLDREVEPSDVYFIPSVGMAQAVGCPNDMKTECFKRVGYNDIMLSYQTWFFIASNNTPLLYEDDEEIERLFRSWDFKKDHRQTVICAEHSLVKWSITNSLNRFSLYSPDEFDGYFKTIRDNQIFDGSLKNVMLEPLGISHFHSSQHPLLVTKLVS